MHVQWFWFAFAHHQISDVERIFVYFLAFGEMFSQILCRLFNQAVCCWILGVLYMQLYPILLRFVLLHFLFFFFNKLMFCDFPESICQDHFFPNSISLLCISVSHFAILGTFHFFIIVTFDTVIPGQWSLLLLLWLTEGSDDS